VYEGIEVLLPGLDGDEPGRAPGMALG
jgi:hypothetical protein